MAAARTRASTVEACPTAGTRLVSFGKAADGGGFLTSDGEEIRLAGIIAVGRAGDAPSSTVLSNARNALSDVLKNRTIVLAPAASRDRYGRIIAQVFADDVWVQGSLLKAGVTRAAPDEASGGCVRELLAAENDARSRRAGYWRDGLFRVRPAEEVRGSTGSFQIVEGTITSATVKNGRAYINFGEDYKTDFTVTIGPDDMRAFRAAKLDVKGLTGKHVRVRGFLEFYNGPEMAIASPAAIEVLE